MFKVSTLAAMLMMALALGSSCAPFNASSAVRSAETQLEKARKVGAARYAPYEYTLASEFLLKAKLTEGYSEFGAAHQYGIRSKEMAIKAQKEARENRLREKILQQRLKARDKARRAK